MALVGIRYSADHTYTLYFPPWSAAVPSWGWHSHQRQALGVACQMGSLGGCSGQLVKRVGLRKAEVSMGPGVTEVREDTGEWGWGSLERPGVAS